ncbi:flavin reductase family protein [Kocuria sp. cx-116]|uniref:flavin reductase family protein n=1 Tax=Kocuria sp. cx-116 TaxID=2771378 RepID=UPI0016859E3D|nr:flavin reductase family protein [Kocuria sp. cx-116]MBD2763594.1 flavin reductase family protein [Kocuria sp. cx-116]
MSSTTLIPQDPTSDLKAFRNALGTFPTGVAIITTRSGDKSVGITVNSFSSVSLDPAVISWSISTTAPSWSVFQHANYFAVNILACEQDRLSTQFARPADDKFAGVSQRSGVTGAPLLEGCTSAFECSMYQHIEIGDHFVIYGKVEAYHHAGHDPLVFHRGAYRSIAPTSDA